MRELIERHFGGIEDQRCQCDVKHRLVDVLVIVMCAVLCGYDELEAIVDYGSCKKEFLREHFGVERVPSKSTLTRIMNMVNAEALSICIVNIMRELLGVGGEIVAIDGKAIRSTCKGSGFRDKLHIVTAYMTANGVCLGQLAVEDKTNEIPVVRELIGMIDIKGKIVTMDAMHCQTETVQCIIDGGGDYVIGLKGNQKTLYDDVALYMADCMKAPGINVETAYTLEKNGDRVEKRICHKAPDISWIENKDEWKDLKNVFSIRRKVSANGKQSEETSYYMTSLHTSCEELLGIVREHWKIESMHWMLDVVFSEDDCRVFSANGQKSMNVFRKLAIALHQCHIDDLQKKTKPTVRQNMRLSLMDDQQMLKVVCSPVSQICHNP